MGQSFSCNCNNKGDNNTEYLIDENSPFKNDSVILDIMTRVNIPKSKEFNLSFRKEIMLKNTLLINTVRRIQRCFRIHRTLKRNFKNVGLVS